MINLTFVFPEVTFNSAELIEIAEALNKPALKKYLISQQHTFIKDIANAMPAAEETAENYLRRHCTVVGALGALEALLAVEASKKGA